MEEVKISYATAKLANMKGFDPKVKLKKNSHYSDLTEKLDPLGPSGAVVVHHYYAANQSLLQKWLRDVHNIHVCPFDEFTGYVLVISTYSKEGKHEHWQHKGPYDKYEDALEVGLFEGLKLINHGKIREH